MLISLLPERSHYLRADGSYRHLHAHGRGTTLSRRLRAMVTANTRYWRHYHAFTPRRGSFHSATVPQQHAVRENTAWRANTAPCSGILRCVTTYRSAAGGRPACVPFVPVLRLYGTTLPAQRCAWAAILLPHTPTPRMRQTFCSIVPVLLNSSYGVGWIWARSRGDDSVAVRLARSNCRVQQPTVYFSTTISIATPVPKFPRLRRSAYHYRLPGCIQLLYFSGAWVGFRMTLPRGVHSLVYRVPCNIAPTQRSCASQNDIPYHARTGVRGVALILSAHDSGVRFDDTI